MIHEAQDPNQGIGNTYDDEPTVMRGVAPPQMPPGHIGYDPMGMLPAEHVYEDLLAAIQEDVEDQPTELPVPARPGVFVKYRTDIDYDTLKIWQKKSQEGKGKNQRLDPKKLAMYVLIGTCVGIAYEKSGKRIEHKGPRGESVTFTSEHLHQMMKVIGGPYGAVKKMYGKDGHIIMTMNRVLQEAGYDEIDFDSEEYGEDPLAD